MPMAEANTRRVPNRSAIQPLIATFADHGSHYCGFGVAVAAA